MPEQNPQDRINEQLRADMQKRFGPAPPPEQTTFEEGMTWAAYNKEVGDYNAYLKLTEETLQKVTRLQKIQKKESQEYARSLREIEKWSGKELKHELDKYDLIQNRKQEVKDLNKLQKEGFDKLNQQEQLRIRQMQTRAAVANAMTGAGVDPSVVSSFRGNVETADLMQMSTMDKGGFAARMANKSGLRGVVGRRILETGEVASGGDLMNPRVLMNIGRTALGRAALPVAAAFAVKHVYDSVNAGQGVYIPGVGSVPFTNYQQEIQRGQTTGEGWGAGIAARFEAFRLGANPFDTLTGGVSNEIVNATRGQGFRGARGRAYQGAVADVYKDLGIDVNTITQMAEIFVRQGRLDEFRTSMENLDDIAKDTGVSVQAVAEQFKNLNDQLIRGGGMQNAPLAAGILGATNRQFPGLTAEQRGQVQQGTLSMMSTFSGLPQQVAETPYGSQLGLQMAKPILGQFAAQFRALGPSHGTPSRAQQLMIGQLRASIPAFQGMDYKTVLQVLRNPGYLDRISHSASRSQVNAAFGAAHESLERFHGQHMNDFLKGRMGPYENMERGERGAYVDTLARKLGDTKMSHDQINKIITPLRRAARTGEDWGDTLSEAGRRARKYSDTHVPKGHLSIRLDGNETRKLLSGKNVGKAVNLEQAFEGKAKSLGGQFLDAFP